MKNHALQSAINIYKAYCFFGRKAVPLIAATSLADGALSKYYGVTRKYFSLIVFWGYMSYKAISIIHKFSNKSADKDDTYINSILDKYKHVLDAVFIMTSIGMILKGRDFFAPKFNLKQIADSGAKLSKIFDQNGAVAKISKDFDHGYVSGAASVVSNIPRLLENKFMGNMLLLQTLNASQIYLTEKYFSDISSGSRLSLYLAWQNNKGFAKIKQTSLLEGGVIALNLMKQYSEYKLGLGKYIVAKYTGIVSKESDILNCQIESLLNDIISPVVYKYRIIKQKSAEYITNNQAPVLILNSLVSTILSDKNLKQLQMIISSLSKFEMDDILGASAFSGLKLARDIINYTIFTSFLPAINCDKLKEILLMDRAVFKIVDKIGCKGVEDPAMQEFMIDNIALDVVDVSEILVMGDVPGDSL